MKTIGITVKGRVQGVSFRQYTADKARALGITGHVRNLHNGDVYIVASGTDDQLQQLVNWCHSGSPAAKVESVEAMQLQPSEFETFKVVR